MDYPEDYNYAEEMVEAHRRGIKVFSIATSGLNESTSFVKLPNTRWDASSSSFTEVGRLKVSDYTVENLDDLVVRLVEEELDFLVQ